MYRSIWLTLASLMWCLQLTTQLSAQEEAATTESQPPAQEEAARTDVQPSAEEETGTTEAGTTETGTTEAATTETGTTEAATTEAAPADAAATPAAPEASQADFATVFTQWKGLLAELRDIRTEYQVAEEAELPGLQEQWNAKLAEGRALVPALRNAAVAAYRESPNSDRELTRFLAKLVADDIRADNYEAADELVQVLVEGECNERDIDNMAGIAAFGVNDFPRAEKHLTAAEGTDSLTESGRTFLSNLRDFPNLAGLWEAELALREAEAQADDLPRVKLETTAGDIVLELFENEVPETVGNFINLVEKGFYDDLTFHRVIHAFMAQGGCPLGNGQGGPGYKIYCECVNDNHRNHFAGSVSMAKTAARNTGGSQFFINFAATPHLNGQHTVFGRVSEGMENLANILKRDPEDVNAPATKIIKAEVIRKRDHEYQPNKVQ